MKCVSCSSSEKAIFDKWSIGHVLMGIITSCFIFVLPWWKTLWISFSYAILWELYENTDFGIYLVSIFCCSPTYQGDHILNSIADIFCNMMGFVILFTIYSISNM